MTISVMTFEPRFGECAAESPKGWQPVSVCVSSPMRLAWPALAGPRFPSVLKGMGAESARITAKRRWQRPEMHYTGEPNSPKRAGIHYG